jgi:pyridoxine 5-phosphate synthase
MTKLSVNLNKFALIRNSRGRDYPNVVNMARRAIGAGAHGITVHPRPDQRHAKYSDVYDLKDVVTEYPGIELNIEGNPIPRFLQVVTEVRPDQCTLVPDAPGQLTSDHGWNLEEDGDRVAPLIRDLKSAGIRVSVFMDPDPGQIDLAPSTGTDRIELYTESYAAEYGTESQQEVFDRFRAAAAHAQDLGLGVNAGHDLNLTNLGQFLTIPNILEVSIGHAIVVESFDHGFESTIRRYIEIIEGVEAA